METNSVPTSFRGTAPQSLLIVLMGSIGDVARGLALVPYLAQAWPSTKITWLVEPKSEGLVRAVRGISRVLVFRRGGGLSAIREIISVLRSEKFDLTIDLQRHLKSGVFSLLSGSRVRLGWNRRNTKEGNWIFNTVHLPYANEDQTPKAEIYFSALDLLGVSRSSKRCVQLSLNQEEIEAIKSRLLSELEGPPLVIVLGSSWSSKDWPPQGYQKLCDLVLARTSHPIVLVGDSSHTKLALELERVLNTPRIVNLAGRTTLEELLVVLEYSAAGVGPDSGPAHIAGMLGKPFVTLFGPTSAIRTASAGNEGNVVAASLGCMPCYRRECPGLDKLCMRLISPERVFEKLVPLLS